MAEFSISTEICLGYHCCGSGEFTYGEGSVVLSDDQVNHLVSLIRENDGETDINALGLQEKYPDIYETLDKAFSGMARKAEYRYWVLNGFENGYFEEPDDFVESFENEGLFSYEPDLDDLEDAKREAFDKWLEGYVNSLDDDAKVDFILKHYGDDIVDTDGMGGDYSICIPREIVDMASKEN